MTNPDRDRRTFGLVKPLPQREEAERAILGAVLLDDSCLGRITPIIKARDFYLEEHRKLFTAFISLASQNIHIDLVTAIEELRRAGELESCGGAVFVASLTEGMPRAANVEHYAKLVKDTAEARDIIQISNETMARCFEGDMSAAEILQELQSRITDLGSAGQRPAHWELLTSQTSMIGRSLPLRGSSRT